MERQQKEAIVEELAEIFKKTDIILLSDFAGMDVETATELRRRFREVGGRFRVVKNTLARRAAREAGLTELAEHFTGQNGLVLAQRDPVAPSKILVEFEKKHKTPAIRSGWIETSLISAAQVRQMAGLPSRETLIAHIAAGVRAPVAGFAMLLHELMRRLVATLDEVAKQRAGADTP